MLDTHAHFFDPDWPDGISWPAPNAPFYGRRLPEDYLDHHNADASWQVIAVETSPLPPDDERLRRLAKTSDLIVGYVANLQPGKDGFEYRLTQFRKDSKFKGIRLRPIDQFDLTDADLIAKLGSLSGTGLTLELGAKTTHRLNDIAKLADALPNVKLVLTHGGHPKISARDPDQPWTIAMQEIAQRRNVHLKLTPLTAFLDPAGPTDLSFGQSLELCRPYFDIYASSFGRDRLIFGSNWPVSEQLESFVPQRKLTLRGLQSQFKDDPLKLDQAGERLYGLNGSGGPCG